jgi:uncharacterized BrkB/YihY/UPF0761 family membrane protein
MTTERQNERTSERTTGRDPNVMMQVVVGWVLTLLLIVLMLVVMVIQSILANDDNFALKVDPGESIRWMVWKFALYGVLPILVTWIDRWRTRLGRWVLVGAAASSFVFYLLHHLAHWQYGQRPNLASHAIDLAIEVVGLWLLASSIRWARTPRAVAS